MQKRRDVARLVLTLSLVTAFLLTTMAGGQWAMAQPRVMARVAAATAENPAEEAWIGVQLKEVPESVRAFVDIPENQGMVVVDVAKDSPAEKAGIQTNDVILEAAGQPISSVTDLTKIVQDHKDKPLALKVLRKGQKLEITVTPEARPAARWEAPLAPFPGDFMDREAWEKWLENFRKQTEKDSPLVFRFWYPWVVVGPDKTGALPKGMTIAITKTGDEPARIVVQKDDQKWEVTEKELHKLPADVRPHVERMLRGGGIGSVEIKPVPSIPQLGKELPKEVLRPWKGPAIVSEERLQKLESTMKELEKRIKELEDRVKQAPAAQP